MVSSVIQSFVYDKEERRLVVCFVSGKVNAYADVPPKTVDGFSSSRVHNQFHGRRYRPIVTRLGSKKGVAVLKREEDKTGRFASISTRMEQRLNLGSLRPNDRRSSQGEASSIFAARTVTSFRSAAQLDLELAAYSIAYMLNWAAKVRMRTGKVGTSLPFEA